MTSRPVWTAFRVITCIMKAGRGVEIVDALRKRQGVISASVHHARGIGTQTMRRKVYSDEKQVLTALVESADADEVFEFIYFEAQLNQPHNGMVMMGLPVKGIGVVPLPEGAEEGILEVPF